MFLSAASLSSCMYFFFIWGFFFWVIDGARVERVCVRAKAGVQCFM